jgi:hypothetical protein
MAIRVERESREKTEPAMMMRSVAKGDVVCGDCMFHMPHATTVSGWCACRKAELRWQPVDAARAACGVFAVWPEGSAAPAFIAAMRL